MKKSIIVLLSVLVSAMAINAASARTFAKNAETANAIKMYKAGNYTQAYTGLKQVVEKDPSNGLAYYYLGMTSTQLGNKKEAIENYEKAIELSPNGILGRYAKKGKTCLEDPIKCNAPFDYNDGESSEDRFIKSKTIFSDEARNKDETEKINNLRREMNRGNEIPPQRFKDYKDFSSQAPSNDEIVNAIRILQRAGLSNMIGSANNSSDLSMIVGNSGTQNNYDVLNMLFSGEQNSKVSPQVLQMLLSSQMSTSF